jgi:ABC-type transporter Mla subunit MlaD
VSDYETSQKRRNLTVGIFVTGATVAIVWLIFKFGDLPIKMSELNSFEVFVQFPIAQGVQTNTPVRFCGYQIGRVTNVEPPKILQDLKTGQFYHQTIVVVNIDKRYDDIPANVDAKLMTRGLGSSYIELVINPALTLMPVDPNRPETKFLVDKMWLQGSTGMTSEFFPESSQKKLDELVTNLNALLKNANDIIGDRENKENIKVTLANLSEATKQATDAMKVFKEFAAVGAETFKNADPRIEKVSVAIVNTSEELGKTATELRMVLDKVNSGQGSAAKFVNDGRLYENLLENTQELEVLLKEMRSFMAKANEKGMPIKLK